MSDSTQTIHLASRWRDDSVRPDVDVPQPKSLKMKMALAVVFASSLVPAMNMSGGPLGNSERADGIECRHHEGIVNGDETGTAIVLDAEIG